MHSDIRWCDIPKLFAIAPQASGVPNTDSLRQGVDYKGWVLADTVGGFGAYMFSGTGPQLTALNALPQVIGLAVVTESGNVRWAELDDAFPPAVRTRINTWLTARGFPNIPTGRTNRFVIDAIFKRLNVNFDLSAFDVAD